METNRLAYFVALSETGSVTAAAQRLHVTPAAVSKAVRALETDLDAELVIRDGRGVVVTDAGRQIAERAGRILADLETLRDSNAMRVARTPAYRFGANGHLATSFHAEFVRSFHDCDITMAELEDAVLVEAIQNNRVDIAVTTRASSHEGIHCEHVCDMPMGVFALPHLTVQHGAVIEALPFSVPGFSAGDDGWSSGIGAADGWPATAPERWNRFPVGSQQTAFELCIAGHSAAYLPRFVVRRHNARSAPSHRLEEVPLGDDVLRKAFLRVYVLRRTSDLNLICVGKIAGPLTDVVTS